MTHCDSVSNVNNIKNTNNLKPKKYISSMQEISPIWTAANIRNHTSLYERLLKTMKSVKISV